MNFEKVKKQVTHFSRSKARDIILVSFAGFLIGLLLLIALLQYFPSQAKILFNYLRIPLAEQELGSGIRETTGEYVSEFSHEQAIIDAAKKVSLSVVSIVISKNVPIYERQFINPFGDTFPFEFKIPQYVQQGTELQRVGAGSGFIVSSDGLVVTNKHVVNDESALYTVYTNDGKKFSAKVLALDPIQDLAVIKIDSAEFLQQGRKFEAVTLGDSSSIQIGQTVIAIGNALGEFSNTVSVGVVSGLGRTISAADRQKGVSEVLNGIIQTDAAINSGNSGGPLVDLKGNVVGINTAIAENAQNIGFAIPINAAKRAIQQVLENNKIVYPFLGVRYVMINADLKEEQKLSVDKGALILRGPNGEAAIERNSPAEKADLREDDIILELNGEALSLENPLFRVIQEYNPGDKVMLKILRDSEKLTVEVVLSERGE